MVKRRSSEFCKNLRYGVTASLGVLDMLMNIRNRTPSKNGASLELFWLPALLFLVFFAGEASASPRVEWSVVTEAGGGIPEVETAPGSLLGSREELVANAGARGKRVVCVASQDGGTTWRDISVIVSTDDPDVDLGDGSMLKDGNLVFYIYRFNKFSGSHRAHPYYSIRIKQSADGGETWTDHSLVAEISPPVGRKSGLWTPRLFQTSTGVLQAYYDDGDVPERTEGGGNRGQWGVMKTWDASAKTWSGYTIVTRPPLSETGPLRVVAEGARTPLELSKGHIWAPVESNIMDEVPGSRSILLRYAESFDFGKTWSWERGQWPILFEKPPFKDGEYYDWSWPLAVRTEDGAVVVLFRSNQLEKRPTKGTARQTAKSIFYIVSSDQGKTWGMGPVHSGFPIMDHGVVALHDGTVIAGLRSKKKPRQYLILKGTVSGN